MQHSTTRQRPPARRRQLLSRGRGKGTCTPSQQRPRSDTELIMGAGATLNSGGRQLPETRQTASNSIAFYSSNSIAFYSSVSFITPTSRQLPETRPSIPQPRPRQGCEHNARRPGALEQPLGREGGGARDRKPTKSKAGGRAGGRAGVRAGREKT